MIKTSLRILSVNVSDFDGGASKAAYRINTALADHGVEVQMLVKNKRSIESKVIPLDDFEPENDLFPAWRFLQNKIKNKVQQFRWNQYPDREDVFLSDLRSVPFHGALQKLEYDILHLHWINLRFLDLKELLKVKTPIVWTLHDCWPFTGICHHPYDCETYKESCGDCPFLHSGKIKDLSHSTWKAKSKIYPLLNLHIVTPSRWLAQKTKGSALLGNFPVTVIPNGIDIQLFSPGNQSDAKSFWHLKPQKRYILAGTLSTAKEKRKGFEHLFQALSLLEHKIDTSEIELLIFGDEKPHEFSELNIRSHYFGFIRDDQGLVMAYRAAHVMVVPSLIENLSNIIMESLACGTPVVAFDTGGNNDMIEHKQNGYLCKAYDPEDLATGIKWCMDNNGSRKLSKHARKKVMSNFDSEIIAERYTQLFLSQLTQHLPLQGQ